MSKYLSKLLGVPEYTFSALIAKLEQATLNKGLDIKLTLDINNQLKTKLAELGLDASDTNAKELFFALKSKARIDDQKLLKKLELNGESSSAEILYKLAKLFEHKFTKQNVWALKRTVLKKLLAANPPNKTMKILHYRSLASMLKRETPAEIYALSVIIEGDKYKHKILESIKKLSVSDFELHKVQIIALEQKRWNSIKKHIKRPLVPVFSLSEANCVVVIPAETNKTSGLALLSSALIIKEFRSVREHSSYLRLKSLDPNLHDHMHKIAKYKEVELASVHGQPIFWHHINRIYSVDKELPEFFGPHISQHDLVWEYIEKSLVKILPGLEFWLGTHYLGMVSGEQVISMNIIDVCFNELYSLEIDNSSLVFLRRSISDELILSYLSQQPLAAVLERQMYKITDINSEFIV